MPYCPKCLSEYRSGITHCADCGAALVAGSAPEPSQAPPPDVEVIRLCHVADPSEADIIRAALAEAGIQCMVQEHGPITARLARVVDGATHDHAIIYVTRNRLEEAQRVLDGLRSAEIEWPEGMEPEESGDAVESD
jgi:hypothetical protein